MTDEQVTAETGLQETQGAFLPQTLSTNDKLPQRIVSIGASAGGLEPLEQFFDAMPIPSGMAFIVIQHLSPDFKSLMDELLLRHTQMPIYQAKDGLQIEANSVYLMPPRKSMTIIGGVLHVEDTPELGRLMLPIDKFLTSLAQDQGEKAVSIILSGTGSDGSLGSKAIEEAGGSVIVQEPVSCKFDAMPRNAMSAVESAMIATPLEMPAFLATTLAGLNAAGKDGVESSPKSRILNALRKGFKTEFGHYKTNTIVRRIERRAQLVKAKDLSAYADLVESNDNELNLLFSDLLIGVTSFFRDPEAFAIVDNKIAPTLLDWMSDTKPIRVWVPGCATGEEAYSYAMLLHDYCHRSGRRPNIKIFATDLHQKSLDFASSGRYNEQSIKNLPKGFLDRYFDKGEDFYQICGEIRRFVVFSRQNLLEDPPFTRIDLISCRNVLIYFSEAAQRRVISLFHFALRKEGHVILGPSESLGHLSGEFETIDNRWRFFRKIREIRLHEGHLSSKPSPDSLGIQHQPGEPGAGTRGVGQRYLIPAYEMLLSRHAPPSLLIDRKGDLAHVFGNAKEYLRVHEGIFTQRLLDHINPDLKAPLSGIIERAWRQMAAISARCPMQRIHDGQNRISIEITAEPLANSTDRGSYLLLTFNAAEPAPIALPDVEPATDLEVLDRDHMQMLQGRVQTLERDLMFTEESLQSVIEELETSNEELQATNEELMASNEELQSTNEELHSVNEELYTVSAEHQQKIDELTQLGADMDNLLRSTDIGTIFVDQRLHIRRYTMAIGKLFNLLEHDIGRPIEHVTFRFKDEHLHRDMRRVLTAGGPVEREVMLGDNQIFFMRILPYIDGTHQRAGVVLTFVDVTPIKTAEASARELEVKLIEQSRTEAERGRDQLFGLLNNAPLLISVHEGADHAIVLTNNLFRESFPVTETMTGKAIKDAFPALCANGGLARFDDVLKTGNISAMHDLQFSPADGTGERHHFSQILQPYLDHHGKQIGVISYAFDVTPVSLARREAERLSRALQDQRERLELAFSAGRMGYCPLRLDTRSMTLSSNVAEILGLPNDVRELPLTKFEQLLTPEAVEKLTAALAPSQSSHDATDLELELKLPAHHPRWLRLFGRRSDRDHQELTVILADITAIKQAEVLLSSRAAELEKANTHLEQFVSIASHDLKSPLRGIHHLTQFMRDDLDKGEVGELGEFLDRIGDQVIKMSRMLDDLLEYARQEDDDVHLEMVDVAQVIKEAASIVTPPDKFTIGIAPNMPKLRTSQGALSLVFRNLISNAVQHHDRQDGHLQIDVDDQGKGLWHFQVSDDGPGLSEDRRLELNTYLSGQAQKPQSMRLGMGIAFVKRAVENNGGGLTFASSPSGCQVSFDWQEKPQS